MTATVLHVSNGDSTAGTLREAPLPGRVVNWADALTDGPVPDLEPADLREVRARFWSGGDPGALARVRSVAQTWDRDLVSFTEHDEVVIWCEHDLYDQLLLLHHLRVFATRTPTKLSLICIDRFPGVERFVGIGQLTAAQLTSLFPARRPVTAAQYRLGSDGWRAFTAGDPTALEVFSRRDLSALPFMERALRGLLEEFPSARNGLPRTERRLLELLSAGGETFGALFVRWMATESVPGYGDSSIWSRLRDMASGPRPLVAMDRGSAEPQPRVAVTITDDGRRVLDGELDWLDIDPFDRWIGGTHLTRGNMWRWDTDSRSLLRPPD